SHHWAHVANGEWARLHLARSKNRYFRKHFPLFSLFLPLFGGHCKHFWPDLPAQLILPFTRVLWLLSPSPLGFPAAGYYGGGVPPWTSLAEARAAHPGQPFWLGATRPGGVTFLGMWRLG
ncbi:MAG: hypothetical protein NZ869_11365, partial [Thermoanaerobaculum sp.]|nr:hypothetical protein [Thermoanaerobaculum sp.]